MGKIEIHINDKETGKNETISTDGAILLYLDENNRIKATGQIDTKALMPYLAKVLMERISK